MIEISQKMVERAIDAFLDANGANYTTVGHKEMRAALATFAEDMGMAATVPVPMRLTCPSCSTLHLDVGEFATKPHHTHACQHCGNVWRPAVIATVGVRFLPGFKNKEAPP